jgi:integrase
MKEAQMAVYRNKDKSGRTISWRAVIDITDPVTGNRTRRGDGKTYRTKREAQAAEADLKAMRDGGVLIDPTRDTVNDLLDRWYETKRGTITSRTLSSYEIAIRVHVKPAIGQAKLQELKHADIQNLVNRWRDTPRMGPKSIRACVSVLKQAYAQALRERLVAVNPVEGIQLPSVKRRKNLTVWTRGEVAAFLEESRSDPLSPLWHLFVLEGMRRSEALGLRWSDLNWREDGRVSAHISQTVLADSSAKGRAVIEDRTKTAAGARTVLLTAETAQTLREHRDRQVFSRNGAGASWIEHGLIVCTSLGTPINPSNVKRNQERIMKAAGVPRLTTHDLRHTAATLMLLAGVPIKIVSEKLGHASVGITMDIYSHVLPDMQDQAADAMDAALARGRAENAKALSDAV